MYETSNLYLIVAVAVLGALVLVFSLLWFAARRQSKSSVPWARPPAASPSEDPQLQLQHVSAGSSKPKLVKAKPERVQLVADEMPVLDILPGKLPKSTLLETIPLDSRISLGLAALLRDTPALLHTGAQLATTAYTLTFSPAIAQGLADGSYQLMASRLGGVRAVAVDSKGIIVGPGSLDAAGKTAVAALAVWQILAVITAQKFLLDINSKLERLSKGIDDIKHWLETDRIGKITGSLSYLRNTANSLKTSDLTTEDVLLFANQLETIELECRQLMAAEGRTRDKVFEEMKALKLSGWGVNDCSRNINANLGEYARHSRTSLHAALVRGVGCQIRAAMPISKQVASARLSELKEEVAKQREHQQQYMTTLRGRISELNGIFNKDKTVQEHQSKLRGHCDEASIEMAPDALLESIEKLNADINLQIEASKEPLKLVAEVDRAGNITSLARLKAS